MTQQTSVMKQAPLSGKVRIIAGVDRLTNWVGRHWLGLYITIYGLFVLMPFTAPILMEAGATAPAAAVYWFYSYFCHQLPERSLFFFGPQVMYSFDQIKSVWPLDGFEGLRQFVGNPAMGYKMAWSDRMISFYGSLWLGGLIFALVRNKIKSLRVAIWFWVGIVPVGVDGFSHMANDIFARTSGTGFRDTNSWLQALTGNVFPQSFYVGDALGSFNSDMRWITGILFGLTTIWFLFPYAEQQMRELVDQSAAQLERIKAKYSS